jgi:phospholipid transport system substrate-binding protein
MATGRRALLCAGGALALAIAVPSQVRAVSTAEAGALIEKVAQDVLGIVNSGRSEAEALPQFEGIFDRYADVPLISRSVMGAAWRSTTDGQKTSFARAFRGYLARKYGRQFAEYRGAAIDIGQAVDEGRKGVLVKSTVRIPGRQPIQVEWQVSDAGGSTRLFNLIIEGVSMLSTERSEIASILESKGGSVDALIDDLARRG